MELTYTLTPDDCRQGVKAYRNRSFFRRWLYRLFTVATVICFVVPLVELAIGGVERFEHVISFLFVGIFWGAILFLYAPYRLGRLMKQNPSAQGERTVTIDDSGLHSRTSLVDTKVAWATIIDARETKRIFALFLSPIQYLPIPKRAMTEAQQQEFRALLQEHITARAKS